MKNFSTWMLVMFMVMFWAFRVVVAFFNEFNMDFGGIVPLQPQIEVALLFIVLLCILLIVKRKMAGALIYFVSYGLYFGTDFIQTLTSIFNGESISLQNSITALVSMIGVILSLAVLMDMFLDKARKANPTDKKTDWFYRGKKFDRELDERADKNNYRTM